jgi:hypothetical protein
MARYDQPPMKANMPAVRRLAIWQRLAILGVVGMTGAWWGSPASGEASQGAAATTTDAPAYVAYYWRVRPGKLDEYNAYIKGTAEKIDENARQAGVFIEVTTVLPTPAPDGTRPDWTHLRIFKLKNLAAVEGLSPGLDAATLRVVPDEAQRKANSARAAEMRDLVRREVWTMLR